MSGILQLEAVQFGDNVDPDENFVWRTNNDGTMTLARGNVGATSQDILTIDEDGHINLVQPPQIILDTSNGYGSTNTLIRRWANLQSNLGGAYISAVDSPTLGGSFVVNIAGVYTVTYQDNFVAAQTFGISLNATATTAYASLPAANKLGIGTTPAADNHGLAMCRRWFAAGSVIRAHTQTGTATGAGPAQATFSIIKG